MTYQAPTFFVGAFFITKFLIYKLTPIFSHSQFEIGRQFLNDQQT
jgi:hypothetical protein